MMRQMQGLMSPGGGGLQPDQLGAGGGGLDLEALVAQLEEAPPEVLQLLKQIIDEKLAGAGGGGGEAAAAPPQM